MDTQALFEFLSKLIDALTAAIKWFSGSSLRVKLLTGIISAVSVLSAIVFWSHDIYSEALRGKIWAWYAASTASETINLSASEQEVLDRQSATLERDMSADLPNFFKHAVVAADLQQKYTPWTLAEVCSALFLDREGIALMASHRADILEFQRLPYRQDPGCDCWRQNDRTEASPQHILVTAWVQAKLGFCRRTKKQTAAGICLKFQSSMILSCGLQALASPRLGFCWRWMKYCATRP